MNQAFIAVLVVVAVVGTALSFTSLLWPFSVAEELGRVGVWFSHEDELPIESRPDADAKDPAIPYRHLRGRG
jgi:hypothetical protein